jgi:hypothetical protein
MEGEDPEVPEQHHGGDDGQDERNAQYVEGVFGEFSALVASPAVSVVPFLVGSRRAIACSPQPATTTPMNAYGSLRALQNLAPDNACLLVFEDTLRFYPSQALECRIDPRTVLRITKETVRKPVSSGVPTKLVDL